MNNDIAEARAEKFWCKLKKVESGCWLWQGSIGKWGYGSASKIINNVRVYLSHRIAYALANNKIPELHVLHSCDTPACCNPAHLREGTNQDNSNDKVARNRQPKGETCGMSKLTEFQAKEILELLDSGVSYNDISRKYNVTALNVRAIDIGFTWKHIQGDRIPKTGRQHLGTGSRKRRRLVVANERMTCTRCLVYKEPSEFSIRPDRPERFYARCRKCMSATQKEAYQTRKIREQQF